MNRRLWLILGVIIVGIIGILLVVLLMRSSPEQNGQQNQPSPKSDLAAEFMAALVNADGATSFGMMSTRLQNEVGGSIAWSESLESTFGGSGEQFRPSETAVVETGSNTGNKPVRYEYTIEFPNGTFQDVSFVIEEINGSLKINEYNTTLS